MTKKRPIHSCFGTSVRPPTGSSLPIRTHPRGSVLVVVLVLLVLTSGLLLAMTRTRLMSRQRLDLAERRAQAEWLARSGLDRAAAQLAQDPDYGGETWNLDPSALDERGSAVVTISVEPAEDSPRDQIITSRAEIRIGPDRRVTKTRTVRVGRDTRSSTETTLHSETDPMDAGPQTAPEDHS